LLSLTAQIAAALETVANLELILTINDTDSVGDAPSDAA
jgi:hypothetical protein